MYELIDLPSGFSSSDSWFGLLRADFSPNPSYDAVMNLLHLLMDQGPSSVPDELNFQLAGELSNVHHVLLQKRNRSFYLALWVEQSCYDVNSKTAIPVPLQQVVIQMDKKATIIVHSLDSSGALRTTSVGSATQHTLEVGDAVTIVEIQNRPAAQVVSTPVSHAGMVK